MAVARQGRRVRAAHLLMALGMAVMFVPSALPPRPVGVAVYLAAAVVCLLPRVRGPHRFHAVTGCLAMAYMFTLPGMARMDGMVMGTGGTTAWVCLVLAAYFIAESAWIGRAMALTADGDHRDAVCHLAAGVAMSYMLITMN